MKVSELITALERAKAEHGDIDAGYYSSAGGNSFGDVTEVVCHNTEWINGQHGRPAIVLWNDNRP